MNTTTTAPVTTPAAPAAKSLDALDIAVLAAEYARLGAVAAGAKERQEQIADELRGLDYGTHTAGALAVSIQHNRRPDARKIAADYPQEQYPSIYKSALDVAEFKRYVAPVIVEQYQIEGPAKVLVKAP